MADFKITKIISKKRDGGKLSSEEIDYVVNSVTKTTVADAVNTPDVVGMDRAQIGKQS